LVLNILVAFISLQQFVGWNLSPRWIWLHFCPYILILETWNPDQLFVLIADKFPSTDIINNNFPHFQSDEEKNILERRLCPPIQYLIIYRCNEYLTPATNALMINKYRRWEWEHSIPLFYKILASTADIDFYFSFFPHKRHTETCYTQLEPRKLVTKKM
jgi:hypothetical protein